VYGITIREQNELKMKFRRSPH